MKKILIFFGAVYFLFAFDLTFTRAFNNFNQGIRLVKNNPALAYRKFKTAYELIQKLKNKDSSQVYYMLGRMYCNGWGVKKNYKLAEKYFLKALKLGNKRVHCCLARLYFKMNRADLAEPHLKYALSHKRIANYCNDLIQPNINKEQ